MGKLHRLSYYGQVFGLGQQHLGPINYPYTHTLRPLHSTLLHSSHFESAETSAKKHRKSLKHAEESRIAKTMWERAE